MPARDLYHDVVRNALIKDGWTITHDPFIIAYEDVRLFADLGIERAFAVEKAEQKRVIEIKTIAGLSLIRELEKAVGQYDIYNVFLHVTDPDRILYLAVSNEVYHDFFQRPAIKLIIDTKKIYMMIFDVDTEEVVEWISYNITER